MLSTCLLIFTTIIFYSIEKVGDVSQQCQQALPSERNLDGRGQAGGEEVSGEVRVHGQQLVGLAGSQLDAVLHGRGQGHLGQRMAGVNGCHLNTEDIRLDTQNSGKGWK